MLKACRRRGAVSLEFVFAFSFLLLLFLVIITFQIIVIQRITAVYNVWRIQRVEGINGDFLPYSSEEGNDQQNETFVTLDTINFKEYIIKKAKEKLNISVEPKEAQENSEENGRLYTINYRIDLIKGLLQFYGENRDSITEEIRWIEPFKPKLNPEHP